MSQPLVRPAVANLAGLQATPGSQYWDGTHLWVRLGGWGSTAGASLDPNDHTVEIPSYSGILVASGSNYVQVLGFNVRHTTMGVGFTGSASHDLVQDVDASYNYTMGFFTASSYNTFRRVTGTRNTIQLIKLDNGADHNLVEDAVGTENMGQGIKLTGSGTQYNTVRNSIFRGGKDVPVNQGGYGGYVQGIDVEQGANHNAIDYNLIERNRRGLMLYQVNSSGGALTGNLIRFNTFSANDDGVVLWDGKYNTTQGKGAVTFYPERLRRQHQERDVRVLHLGQDVRPRDLLPDRHGQDAVAQHLLHEARHDHRPQLDHPRLRRLPLLRGERGEGLRLVHDLLDHRARHPQQLDAGRARHARRCTWIRASCRTTRWRPTT